MSTNFTGAPIKIFPLDLLSLHIQLHQLVTQETSQEDFLLKLLQLLIGLTNAAGAIYAVPQQNQLIVSARILSKQALQWHSELETLLITEIQRACEKNQLQIRYLEENQKVCMMATPIIKSHHCEGIALILLLGSGARETFATILQLVANYANISQSNAQKTILPLITHLLNLPTLKQVYDTTTHFLQESFHCQWVLLGLVKGQYCRLHTISQLTEIQRHAEVIHAIEELLNHTLLAKNSLDSNNSEIIQQYPIINKIIHLTNSKSLLTVPLLPAPNAKPHAILLFLWATDRSNSIAIQQLSLPLGVTLATAQRTTAGRFRTLWLSFWQQKFWKKLLLLLLLLTLITTLMINIPYKISGKVTIQPTVHRFVTAPFDGILKQTLSEPGDVIVAGDVLARLDGREIEWNLSGLTADRKRAQKQKDVSTVARDTAAAQIAQLEMERIDAQIELLQYHTNHLEIKSPIDGIVISGDLKRVEGSPVNKGQSLYEIAPLDSMLVELALPSEEIIYIQPDMQLQVFLDAYPYQQWDLPITIVHPRAIVRDNDSVFIVEARLDNAEGKLRPGMKGKGHIVAEPRSLGWIVFHKVWENMVRWWR